MNAKTIKLIAQIEARAAAGKNVDFTSCLCIYGFNAPVAKAIDALIEMGSLGEVGKTSLGQPLYRAAA